MGAISVYRTLGHLRANVLAQIAHFTDLITFTYISCFLNKNAVNPYDYSDVNICAICIE